MSDTVIQSEDRQSGKPLLGEIFSRYEKRCFKQGNDILNWVRYVWKNAKLTRHNVLDVQITKFALKNSHVI